MASTLQEEKLSPDQLLALYGIVPNQSRRIGKSWSLRYATSDRNSGASVLPHDEDGDYRGFDWARFDPSWKTTTPSWYQAPFAVSILMLVSNDEEHADRIACHL